MLLTEPGNRDHVGLNQAEQKADRRRAAASAGLQSLDHSESHETHSCVWSTR
jgi:hypothetical protein